MKCKYCRIMWVDDRSPEMCGNRDLIKKYGRPNYCAVYNPNNECNVGKLNFKGLLRIIFGEKNG